MRLLIIGGTEFVGRAVAEEALRRGHEVTTFNRGVTAPDVPGVRPVRGDRTQDADLDRLRGQEWDAVVDTCGYVPEVVGRAARLLAGSSGRYVFVSSVSACVAWPKERITDDTPRYDCPADARADAGEYGYLKAGCERAVEEAFGDRALVVRPGLILGPYENVGRLPWWLRRVARGGQVLAPGDPDTRMQLIDARDLAAWMLDAAERGLGGVFYATGPAGNTTMGRWLAACVEVTGADAELVWVPDRFLLDHQVRPWTELPLWRPDLPEYAGVWEVETARAEAAGLRTRPVRDTVRDTWEWLRGGGEPVIHDYAHLPEHGIDPGKEQRILTAWRSRGAA